MEKNKDKSKAKIYIDGANIFYTQKKMGWFIDWKKVDKYLQKQWNVSEIRYYTGVKTDDKKMMSFLRYLDKIDIVPITKPVKVIKISDDDKLKKVYNYPQIYKSDCDVEITTDILLDRAKIDEIILFSGDSDFRYLIEKLKDLGKK